MDHSDDVSATRAAKNEIALREYNEKVDERRQRTKPILRMAVRMLRRELRAAREAVHGGVPSGPGRRHALPRRRPGEEHVSLSVEHVIRREEHYWIVEKIGVAET